MYERQQFVAHYAEPGNLEHANNLAGLDQIRSKIGRSHSQEPVALTKEELGMFDEAVTGFVIEAPDHEPAVEQLNDRLQAVWERVENV